MAEFLESSHAKRSKFIITGVAIMLLIALVFFVQQFQNNNATKLCFVLNEGAVSTYLVIEDGSPNASMTIVERRNGKDVEPPSTGPGTLEDNAFVLVDGTRLEFNDAQLVWPEGSLLAGLIFVESECPVY